MLTSLVVSRRGTNVQNLRDDVVPCVLPLLPSWVSVFTWSGEGEVWLRVGLLVRFSTSRRILWACWVSGRSSTELARYFATSFFFPFTGKG